MNLLICEGSLLLIKTDLLIRFGSLQSVHSLVRKNDIADVGSRTVPSAQQLCQAIDLACVFYFKTVLCLQRSVATTLLLRRYGHKAEMVIGAQMLPFKSHAWVELAGVVVNDKPYMLEIYQVLERC